MTLKPSPSDDDDDAPSAMLSLTSSQFRDALARHVDASKPDPLAWRQIENLRLGWEPRRRHYRRQEGRRDGSPRRPPLEGPARRRRRPTAIPHDDAAEPDDDDDDDDDDWKSVCGGTLTLSSEHISIAIGVDCECRKTTMTTTTTTDLGVEEGGVRLGGGATSRGGGAAATRADGTHLTTTTATMGELDWKSFGDELYFGLSVSADFASSPSAAGAGEGDAPPRGGKSDRKERATRRKLRSAMRERLRSDPLVRCLLVDERGIDGTSSRRGREEGVPLCEALIRRGRRRDGDLEERVNVYEEALGGIRNAIFGHLEDNLDVLEIVLNMPYLPRGSFSSRGGGEEGANPTVVRDTTTSSTLCELAQRAYLRLLEDAMFDACEKEGEDELLEDLNIS